MSKFLEYDNLLKYLVDYFENIEKRIVKAIDINFVINKITITFNSGHILLLSEHNVEAIMDKLLGLK